MGREACGGGPPIGRELGWRLLRRGSVVLPAGKQRQRGN